MQPPFLLSSSLPLSVQTSYANGPLFMSRARAAHLEHLVRRRLVLYLCLALEPLILNILLKDDSLSKLEIGEGH